MRAQYLFKSLLRVSGLGTHMRYMGKVIRSLAVTVPAAVLVTAGSVAYAAGGAVDSEYFVKAPINSKDTLSIQRGAQLYVNYCYGCHSLKYLRYERLSQDLRIPEDLVMQQLMFTGSKMGDQMRIAMTPEQGATWFGATPPDLTLVTRVRGADWVYSYLTSFYPDASRPYGYNNHIYPSVGMPYILEQFEAEKKPEAFKKAMADVTNFLAYAAEPTYNQRKSLGVKVLLFLAFFSIPIYFLNKEYWKNIR